MMAPRRRPNRPSRPQPLPRSRTPTRPPPPRRPRRQTPSSRPSRRRPGIGSSSSSPGTGFTTAMPRGGRGVKVTEEDEEEARKKAAAKKANSLSTRRRGPDGRRGEADEKLREFTDADIIARRDALNAASATRRNFDRHLTKVEQRGTHIQARSAVEKGEPVELEEPITVKSLSAAI